MMQRPIPFILLPALSTHGRGPATDTGARAAGLRPLLLAVALLVAAVHLPLEASVTTLPEASGKAPPELVQSPEQRLISNIARRYLSNLHYQPAALDDTLSARIYEQYLESLDPARVYFLAGDVAYFERYRTELDDYLKRDDYQPAFEIFKLYRQRFAERVAQQNALLDQPMDFTRDETFKASRDDEPWAVNEKVLDEYWRRRVKNDWLRLRLAGKDDAAIHETLAKRYRTLGERIAEFGPTDVFSWFLNAYTQAIEPHTNYFSPRDSEAFDISMRLSLEGIGALLERDGEYTQVRSIVPGGPASLDGRLQPGDRIIGVGQEAAGEVTDVVGWRLDDVVDLIRGPKGTVVRLEILPAEIPPGGTSDVLALTRGEVKLEAQAAQKDLILVPDGERTRRIGVIKLPGFYLDMEGRARNEPGYRSSTNDVRRLIQELRGDGIDGLIVDLRDNGGGALSEAVSMTGLFIDTGPVVQVRDNRGRVKVEADYEPGMAWDGPLAVLVNRYSASASEIFAAAIQDYHRGLVVGEATFGKGTVQNLIDLDAAFSHSRDARLGQLKVTMAQFFRINGGSTQLKGVSPDIAIPSALDPEDIGESAYNNALPWSEIDAANFEPLGDLGEALAYVDTRHRDRLRSAPDLRLLQDEINAYQQQREQHFVSLNEATRRAEIEADKARRAAQKQHIVRLEHSPRPDPAAQEPPADAAAPASDEAPDAAAGEAERAATANDDLPDIPLDESARILADYIAATQQKALLVSRQADTAPPSGG